MHCVAVLVITLLLAIAPYAPSAHAAQCSSRGDTYTEALRAKAEATTAAARILAETRESGPSADELRARARWGNSVGRWWDECARYWPRSELPTCMLVIKVESGGDPNCNDRSLFQLTGYDCDVSDWRTNIRLAYKLWRARGWYNAWFRFW